MQRKRAPKHCCKVNTTVRVFGINGDYSIQFVWWSLGKYDGVRPSGDMLRRMAESLCMCVCTQIQYHGCAYTDGLIAAITC